jgi:hypothetical protein
MRYIQSLNSAVAALFATVAISTSAYTCSPGETGVIEAYIYTSNCGATMWMILGCQNGIKTLSAIPLTEGRVRTRELP